MLAGIDKDMIRHGPPSSGLNQSFPFPFTWIGSHTATLLYHKRNPIKCQPISGISGDIKT